MPNPEETNDAADAGDELARHITAYAETAADTEDDLLMADTIAQAQRLAQVVAGTAQPAADGAPAVDAATAAAALAKLRETRVGRVIAEAASDEGDPRHQAARITNAVGIAKEEDAMEELGLEYVEAAYPSLATPARPDSSTPLAPPAATQEPHEPSRQPAEPRREEPAERVPARSSPKQTADAPAVPTPWVPWMATAFLSGALLMHLWDRRR